MWRSLQFIPASDEKKLSKAELSRADALIFDLEDSVALDEKERARKTLFNFIGDFTKANDCGVIVRINSLDACGKEDLETLASLKRIDAFLLPKASAKNVKALGALLDDLEREFHMRDQSFAIIALIETAVGLWKAYETALASARVKGMLFGAEDFSTQMGIERTAGGDEIEVARNLHAIACRAAGVESYDTPFTDTKDSEALANDTIRGKKAGMTGKSAIHPCQIDIINRIYTPSEREVKQARRIVAAGKRAQREGKGAFAVDGKMVDVPIIQRAENLLNLIEAIGRR